MLCLSLEISLRMFWKDHRVKATGLSQNEEYVVISPSAFQQFWIPGKNFTGIEFILSNRAPRIANSVLVEGELDNGIHVSFDEYLSLGKLKNKIQSFKCVCR